MIPAALTLALREPMLASLRALLQGRRSSSHGAHGLSGVGRKSSHPACIESVAHAEPFAVTCGTFDSRPVIAAHNTVFL